MIKGLTNSQIPFDQKSFEQFEAMDLSSVIKYQVHPLDLKPNVSKENTTRKR